jgi:hypothetical protein
MAIVMIYQVLELDIKKDWDDSTLLWGDRVLQHLTATLISMCTYLVLIYDDFTIYRDDSSHLV